MPENMHKKIYDAWINMRQRCFNQNHAEYHNYGGRGISICKEWEDFNCFLQDIGVPEHQSLSLDRVDNNKGYSKDNCCWSSKSDQSYNKRSSKSNTSGKVGVSWCKQTGKWRSTIKINGKFTCLGRFEQLEDAVAVREEAEIELYGRVKGKEFLNV